MISVLFPAPSVIAGRFALAAVRRSVSRSQARAVSFGEFNQQVSPIVMAVDVPDEWGTTIVEQLRKGSIGKLIVFGHMPEALARHLGCELLPWPESLAEAARSAPARPRGTAESRASVRYSQRTGRLGGRQWKRAFEHFDFSDEWNNLGFGAIRADASIWSIRQPLDVPHEARLAEVHVDGTRLFSYAALWELPHTSVLWFNRAVGPCDSFEWRLVEHFLSAFGAGQLPCQPVLSEIPCGYDAAVTSRLDCDEDVESARSLWDAYRRLSVPFSLAVHTSNLGDATHHAILRELAVDGDVALLSHTATHAPNWGGSYEAALVEGRESKRLLEAVTGRAIRYAVSPFHHSPPYALEALADVGYSGCVGGIICNDPEFLIARGGTLAGMPEGFIGHSQQTMLHGDCMLDEGDALAMFKQSFDLAFESRTLFGYLDHPFSPRYQYGWETEAVRIEAHEKLIAYIRERAVRPLFLHENAALDFLLAKSALRIVGDGAAFRVELPPSLPDALPIAVEFQGECVEAMHGKRLQ